jgi:hypothetical protein
MNSQNIIIYKNKIIFFTLETLIRNRGGGLENLRMLMGHSSLKTTQKYLHLTKQNIIDEYAKVMRNTDYLPQK